MLPFSASRSGWIRMRVKYSCDHQTCGVAVLVLPWGWYHLGTQQIVKSKCASTVLFRASMDNEHLASSTALEADLDIQMIPKLWEAGAAIKLLSALLSCKQSDGNVLCNH